MKRAVVTGGAGFLGSHLTDRLLAEGYSVVAVDNFVTGNRDNVRHLAADSRFELVEADVIKPFDVEGPVDYIFHFASPASPVDYLELPIETLLVGSAGTHNSLDLAVRKGAQFLIASTSEVYGDPIVHPQTESYWGNVNPIGTRSCYDEAKRYGEAAVSAYRRKHGIDAKIVRIFNTYGPRMRIDDGRVVPTFLHQALTNQPITIYGTGKQTRSFCYVSDLIDGIYKLSQSELPGPVNVGNPMERTMLEFADEVQAVVGRNCPIRYLPLPTEDDPKQRNPDITQAKSKLGWEPVVLLRDGLRATADDFARRLDLSAAATS